jgi:hypothetical protein
MTGACRLREWIRRLTHGLNAYRTPRNPGDCDSVAEPMLSVRRHLAWVVCGWIACQLAGVLATPVGLWRLTAAHDDRECECPVAPGQACPMHHDQKSDQPVCKLRNAFPTADAVLLSLNSGFGIVPEPIPAVAVLRPGAIVRTGTPSAVLRIDRPESPPPRA